MSTDLEFIAIPYESISREEGKMYFKTTFSSNGIGWCRFRSAEFGKAYPQLLENGKTVEIHVADEDSDDVLEVVHIKDLKESVERVASCDVMNDALERVNSRKYKNYAKARDDMRTAGLLNDMDDARREYQKRIQRQDDKDSTAITSIIVTKDRYFEISEIILGAECEIFKHVEGYEGDLDDYKEKLDYIKSLPCVTDAFVGNCITGKQEIFLRHKMEELGIGRNSIWNLISKYSKGLR